MLPEHRYLGEYLIRNPENLKKMIFIAGPRQVGKTTLLENLGSRLGFSNIAYLNWDRPVDRKPIRDIHYDFFKTQLENSKNQPLIIFDELHKFPKWKAFLKGYYDTFRGKLSTFVTGSARLDVYRRGGDSLLGRYWLYRLYPFTLSEAMGNMAPSPPLHLSSSISEKADKILEILWKWGGFPEPFLSRSETHHRRWVRMRKERLIQEDLRDLSRIHDLSHIDNLMDLVIGSVSSSLSLNSLREELQVSYNAVKTWSKWLEAIYYCFPITPFSKKITHALKKEAKYYLLDWSEISDPGARFENMIAVHLKKSVDFWNDSGMGNYDLHYVRDLEKREVDFLILKDKKPWMLIEAKTQLQEIPSSLRHMSAQLKPEYSVLVANTPDKGQYQVLQGNRYWVSGAAAFLQNFV